MIDFLILYIIKNFKNFYSEKILDIFDVWSDSAFGHSVFGIFRPFVFHRSVIQPFVIRPFVIRPFVFRPLVIRSFVFRPPVFRPYVGESSHLISNYPLPSQRSFCHYFFFIPWTKHPPCYQQSPLPLPPPSANYLSFQFVGSPQGEWHSAWGGPPFKVPLELISTRQC